MRVNGREVREPPREPKDDAELRIAIFQSNKVGAMVWPLAADTIGALKAELDRLVKPPEVRLGTNDEVIIHLVDSFSSDGLQLTHYTKGNSGEVVMPRYKIQQLKALCEAALNDA